MDDIKEIINNLTLELRRGTIVLSTLSQLKTPKYGYSLVQTLEEKQIFVDPSTLYPLLRRLEKQGLLVSEWETSGTKPRKYYIMSESGMEIYHMLCEEWRKMTSSLDILISDGGSGDGI